MGLDLVSSLCRLTSEGKIKYQDLLEVFISNPDVNFALMEISTSKLKAKYAKKGDYKIISSLRDIDQSLERDELRLKASETFVVSSPGLNAISDLNISNKINNSTQGDAVSLFTDIFSEIKYKIDKGEFSQDSLMFILEVAKMRFLLFSFILLVSSTTFAELFNGKECLMSDFDVKLSRPLGIFGLFESKLDISKDKCEFSFLS